MRESPLLSEALSQTIEALRQERGLTKTSLADFASLERRYLREIEYGQKKPTLNAVYCICEALGVAPLRFFERLEERRRILQKTGDR